MGDFNTRLLERLSDVWRRRGKGCERQRSGGFRVCYTSRLLPPQAVLRTITFSDAISSLSRFVKIPTGIPLHSPFETHS
jgi:hypothetical protein